MDEQPHQLRLSVAAVRQLGQQLQRDIGRHEPDLRARGRRRWTHASGPGDGEQRRWVERARAWDIDLMAEHGCEVIAAFVALMKQACLRALAAAGHHAGRTGQRTPRSNASRWTRSTLWMGEVRACLGRSASVGGCSNGAKARTPFGSVTARRIRARDRRRCPATVVVVDGSSVRRHPRRRASEPARQQEPRGQIQAAKRSRTRERRRSQCPRR